MDVFSRFADAVARLKSQSNYRTMPGDGADDMIDLTSNDYLGIASREKWVDEFMSGASPGSLRLTSSASRLLASNQKVYSRFEGLLARLYGREALLFNSGYHANTGIISALADGRTMILADRLVHASIIDGIKLSKGKFTRFHHNDFIHLERLIEKYRGEFQTILVVVESVYSMDGDRADIDCLIDIKRQFPEVMLYVDEAHAFGVEGPGGLGLVAGCRRPSEVDVVVGTLGKAAASAGAFAIVNSTLKEYLVNTSRSLIFSTALPPISVAWSEFVVGRMLGMDSERARLKELSNRLADAIGSISGTELHPSHILPLIIGDAASTISLSRQMATDGVKVLPIRIPTVPPGTERLRFSLSSELTDADIEKVKNSLTRRYEETISQR